MRQNSRMKVRWKNPVSGVPSPIRSDTMVPPINVFLSSAERSNPLFRMGSLLACVDYNIFERRQI